MKCEDISADWAAQRIKGLSLYSAAMNAIIPRKWFQRKKSKTIKTLIDSFRYPRKGPGMLWEACAHKIKLMGGEVRLSSPVYRCEYQRANKQWEVHYHDTEGETHQLNATHVISSAPLREMVLNYLRPLMPPPALIAANELHYRDFLIVVLILKDRQHLTDNWIYVHDKHVDVARIQNFKSWSPDMVPDQSMCCYGLEYFCFKGDKWWEASDEALIAKATKEILQLGLADKDDIVDGCVVRQAKAYPVYNNQYQQNVETINKELEKQFPTLYLVGRNGMHKYNNQDHAMMTAMLTVKNILTGERVYDVWNVNQDAEYIETGKMDSHLAAGLRAVPQSVREERV
jgi:protoporphyrinogen oxidase